MVINTGFYFIYPEQDYKRNTLIQKSRTILLEITISKLALVITASTPDN